MLKCRSLQSLEVLVGDRILDVQQIKEIVAVAPKLSAIGLECCKSMISEMMPILAEAVSITKLTIWLDEYSPDPPPISCLICNTWAKHGYRPQNLSVVYFANCPTYLYRNFSNELPPCTAPHTAVLREYSRNTMPLDIFPVPPLVEYHFGGGTSSMSMSRTTFPGRPNIVLDLANISDTTCVSAIRPQAANLDQNTHCYIVKPFHEVAGSIVNLDLSTADDLLPAHLTVVSEMCCSLQQLVLLWCTRCLTSLEGLRNVAMKCPLKGLSLEGIEAKYVPCTMELWTIISSMEKLTHLMIESCLLVQSFESTTEGALIKIPQYLKCLQIYICCACSDDHLKVIADLPHLTYLKIFGLRPSTKPYRFLVEVFKNCPSLKCVDLEVSYGAKVDFPEDPDAYASLEQLVLFFSKDVEQHVSEACMNALVLAKHLTKLHLMSEKSGIAKGLVSRLKSRHFDRCTITTDWPQENHYITNHDYHFSVTI